MNTLVARVVAAGLAIAASACGAGPATAPTPAPAPAAAVAPAQAQAAAPAEAAAPAASYTPGGMWMPEQLLAKADTLKSMRAIERADSLTDPERVRAWLYRIHRNVIVDTLRSRARQRRLRDQAGQEANLQAEAAMSIPRESCKCSVSLAKQINPAYASVLELVDAGDATVAEAARVLGISANNAAVRLHRARTALKAAMLQHCGVTNPAECDDCRCVYDGCCPE